ncbi:MAG TPA: NAD(P)H-hydrate dehydratase [Saprospiraceae bacterium]|nr:NAD(P)H-hydrate dehydratase [Saprospiraceae bacterium]
MKLFLASQIKNWDQFTITTEPIPSIDLMERAASAFVRQFSIRFPDTTHSVHLIAGPGNNGGDALAIARMLHFKGYPLQVSICEIGSSFSEDFSTNLDRLPAMDTIQLNRISEDDPLPNFNHHTILIDGIFGTGLNRPVEGYWAKVIQSMNKSPGAKVAIDIPSGLPAEGPAFGTAFQADYSISFQRPKLSFFLAENAPFVGQWQAVDIGLASTFAKKEYSPYFLNRAEDLGLILKKRTAFSHKGSFGHALLIAGSYGMLGAAQLCGRACLRSGSGLLTMYAPKIAYEVLQLAIPEAMVEVDPNTTDIQQVPDLSPYSAVGIGPGIGESSATASALWQLLKRARQPLVIDADALNILAKAPKKLKQIPKNSILTPHPGEFKRLFGASEDSWEQVHWLQKKSQELQLIIILKGAHTRIALPNGKIFFNTSGNPGMATGGSGDVLTGILTGLLAQGYSPEQAALLGVFLHGSAGDFAREEMGEEALIASDIILHLGKAFQKLRHRKSGSKLPNPT